MRYLLSILLLGSFLLIPSYSYSQDIPNDQAIRAIIGEDSSSYEGMYAVACAIRNRGTLKGVYGLKAIRWSEGSLKRFKGTREVETISAETFHQASKAWFSSESGIDVTKGATHWEMKSSFPWWAKSMTVTLILNNVFYK